MLLTNSKQLGFVGPVHGRGSPTRSLVGRFRRVGRTRTPLERLVATRERERVTNSRQHLAAVVALVALLSGFPEWTGGAAFTSTSTLASQERVEGGVVSPERWELLPALEGKDYGKLRMRYSDFVTLPDGVQYRDVRIGDTEITPRPGDRVVLNWSGYTIGYYGRIFEAKNRVQGGAFGDDREYSRYVLGRGELVPALEETLLTMHPGGVRQVIVPPERGYPLDGSDWNHDRVGPKPRTFSGMRALNFVLENKGLVDKTLLFNIELIRIDRPGENGFETVGRRQ